MKRRLLPALLLTLPLAACGDWPDSPLPPAAPPPRLLPLEQALQAPVAQTGADMAKDLAERGADLRKRGAAIRQQAETH